MSGRVDDPRLFARMAVRGMTHDQLFDSVLMATRQDDDGGSRLWRGIQHLIFGDDETQYDAKVVGHDQLTDTALIQLVQKPKGALPEARFGDSSCGAGGRSCRCRPTCC